MEIEVGGVDAMADLVQGTTELTVDDGAGYAGEIENEVHLSLFAIFQQSS